MLKARSLCSAPQPSSNAVRTCCYRGIRLQQLHSLSQLHRSANPCKTCADAAANPRTSRNHRLNPSLLIQLRHPQDMTIHNVLIDCGKTFREAALKVFPRYGVSDLSGVLLTHEHADACFGMDDLREFSRRDDLGGGLDVFADEATLLSSFRTFRYLFPKAATLAASRVEEEQPSHGSNVAGNTETLLAQLTATPGAGSGWNFRQTGATWTATLQWHLLQPMTLSQLVIRPRQPAREGEGEEAVAPAPAPASFPFVAVPVLHGPDYYSEAYLLRTDSGPEEGSAPHGFTAAADVPRLLFYCSDVSCVDDAFMDRLGAAKQLLLLGTAASATKKPPTAAQLEAAAAVPLDVLILDLLTWRSYYSTHLCGEDSLKAAERIGARHTFFVGMSHSVNTEEMSAELEKRGVANRMSAGYDGCTVAGEPLA